MENFIDIKRSNRAQYKRSKVDSQTKRSNETKEVSIITSVTVTHTKTGESQTFKEDQFPAFSLPYNLRSDRANNNDPYSQHQALTIGSQSKRLQYCNVFEIQLAGFLTKLMDVVDQQGDLPEAKKQEIISVKFSDPTTSERNHWEEQLRYVLTIPGVNRWYAYNYIKGYGTDDDVGDRGSLATQKAKRKRVEPNMNNEKHRTKGRYQRERKTKSLPRQYESNQKLLCQYVRSRWYGCRDAFSDNPSHWLVEMTYVCKIERGFASKKTGDTLKLKPAKRSKKVETAAITFEKPTSKLEMKREQKRWSAYTERGVFV